MKEKPIHSELTFQLMIESTPNAIVLINKEGKIAYVNKPSEQLFGYDRTELIGQLIEILIPPRFHQNHPRFRDMFFSSPSVRSMGAGRDLYALRKDGSEFPVEIGLNPLVTTEGTLVLASIIDITERKKAEERFKLVVESAPNAMILVNQDGIITLVNAQTERLFGFQKKELIGNRLEMLIPNRFKEKHPDHRESYFQAPSTRPMGAGRELFGLRKDKKEVQIEIGLNPITTDEGQMVLASIIDITERKVQESIRAKVKEMENRNQELEQFAYIASHDLQEPLRTISNFITVIKEDCMDQLDSEALGYLNTIGRATDRMVILVKALLEYSRLGVGRQVAEVDCEQLVATVVSDLNNLIKETGTQIEIGSLPIVKGYDVELRQLFQNLITNAIKFRKKNQLAQVRVMCKVTESAYEFSIVDNGIGISKKNFDRVFYIFQRLNPANTYEGHGIGLAYCKKIVELHNGRIWIESEERQGTTFNFTIPKITHD
ncbi:PAS domain S-box protein [Reichenbachiella ulvae]|uniref:histidine kinase n=1 Tax=Reichenbachiella ulvae TaxID=2980104 RepID=A0ABT3CQ56_9BACT|nr:PAS domain S-box protein [Reichenbachiella ulvae]MCV9385836.1 PAS domain S-box protein [Reichenbachiella ulvae]